LVCALVLTGAALADDVLPPIWLGDQNTVHAEWDTWAGFNTDPTPIAPDSWYSIPADAVSAPDAQAYDTATYLTEYEGRSDVVAVDGPWQLDFLAHNFVDDLSELWLQVTYWAPESNGVDFFVDTDPYTPDINGPYFNGVVEHTNGWITEAYSFVIAPSPASELITLDFPGAGIGSPAYIDQVVIDTVAVPEPGGLLVLIAGVALLRRRR
jgi:hypothetical protein